MLVTTDNIRDILRRFLPNGHYALDTETYGIRRHDRLYSIILSDENLSYYFNFHNKEDHQGNVPHVVLPRECLQLFAPILGNPQSTWYMHNAKFDMGKLALEGLEIRGTVHCTMAMARLVRNNHLSYSLDNCVRRIHGYDIGKVSLEEYISKNKLYEHEVVATVMGKEKKKKTKYYHKIPFKMMVDYGETDGKVTHRLGEYQRENLKDKSMLRLVATEQQLTKVCFAMEQRGVQLDLQYVRQAYTDQEKKLKECHQEFLELTGIEYRRGPTCLVEAFQKLGESIPQTGKGNPSFCKEALADRSSPIVKLLKRMRFHEKIIDTYYSNFISLSDCRGVLRANIMQAGTETGRFSYSSPNLQNLPKEDSDAKEFYVRKCFVPRPGYCFVMLDYDQQEYRLMLDYAGEDKLIFKINKGLDVHQATAELLNVPGITRKIAKMINFMLLYGGGTETLAKQLGIPVDQARTWRRLYFENLPRVTAFFRNVVDTAKHRGWIRNWAGRKCYLSATKGAYIMPNHLIQGGCADIIKDAMVKIHSFLADKKSAMVIQVHDELLLEVHESELHIVPTIKGIMESIYRPKNNLKLTCGVEHSWKSFAAIDKVEGFPVAKETRNAI